MNNIKVISGFGQFHTNEPDPSNPDKKLTPYSKITWAEIQALVDEPQEVNKPQAQWIIPSIYPSRSFNTQEQQGQFPILWADLDDNQLSVDQLSWWLDDKFRGANYEVFNTSSATQENKKARILIPLKTPLSGTEWIFAQQVFNDLLEASEIKPDRATERPAQLCYLPNKPRQDSLYRRVAVRHELFFDPLQTWASEIETKKNLAKAETAVLSSKKRQAEKRRGELSLSNTPNVIEAFNQSYTPQEWMSTHGYDQQGNSFRHPNSQTGNYSATVKTDSNGVLRVNALSSADPLYTGGQGAHDAFSCFKVLVHNGDHSAALIDAGDNLLTIGGVSFNKALQRDHMQKKAQQPKVEFDIDDLLTAQESRNGTAQPTPIPPQAQDSYMEEDINYSSMPDFEEVGGESEPDKTGQKQTSFKFANATELMNRAYAPDFLIKTLFESNALGQIFGATGSGKSFVVLDMAYCIAAGLDYHGLAVKQGNVAYICGEGFRAIGRRVKALQNKYDADVDGKLFISEQPGAFIDIGVTGEVAEAIKEIGNVNLVIIDTYHRNMGGGNENSADDFGLVLRNIDAFLKPLNVAVLIVHHSGHMDTDRSRGSSAIRAAMDFEYQVNKNSDTVTLKPTKIKDGTTPPPMYFTLVDSEIGLDHEGNAITSAYLDSKADGDKTGQDRTKRKLSARDDAILQTLNDAITSHGIEPSSEIKAKFGGFDSFTGKLQKIVHIDHWRELAHKTISVDADTEEKRAASLQKAFKRCRDKLFNDKYTVEHGQYVWRFFEEKES
jgi:hypothetical protein